MAEIRTDDLLPTQSGDPLSVELVEQIELAQAGTAAFEETLASLVATHGDTIYTSLIFALTHMRFDAAAAKQHWDNIQRRRHLMEQLLGSEVDVRVALVDHFIRCDPGLKNPKCIEMQVFEQTQASAVSDELTGLHNYRYFADLLNHEVHQCQQYGSPLSLVMIDVDHFKAYNDRCGHGAGNDALAAIGQLTRSSVRSCDIAARYGGEEFAVVLASTPKTGAALVAERLRDRIEQHQFNDERLLPGGRMTVSAGVATCPGDARNASDLIRAADEALYAAKRAGRNRVNLFGNGTRSFRRLETTLPGTYQTGIEAPVSMETVSIGEGGVRFRTERFLNPGALLGLNIALPECHNVQCSGQVLRCEPCAHGPFHTSVKFVDARPADRLALRHLVGAGDPPRHPLVPPAPNYVRRGTRDRG